MAITVPSPGQMIDAVTFGQPVANQLNGIAPTTWTTMSLLNGATAHGGRLIQYRKIGDIVYVRGQVLTTSTATFAQLPAGFRFANWNMEFPVSLYTGSRVPGVLLINTDGTMALYDAAGNAGIYVSFSITGP